MKWHARFFKALPEITARYPRHRWVLLTLTVKNPDIEDLRETLKSMNKGFQRLTQRKCWPADGWVKSVEITAGRDGRPHPHIHVLMMVPAGYFSGQKYLKQYDWTQLWIGCARLNYWPQVDVRAVKSSQENGIEKAIVEVMKYTVKPADLEHSSLFLQGITEQLHKSRSISVCGALRPFIAETEPEPEEPDDSANSGGFYFDYHRKKGEYCARGE